MMQNSALLQVIITGKVNKRRMFSDWMLDACFRLSLNCLNNRLFCYYSFMVIRSFHSCKNCKCSNESQGKFLSLDRVKDETS